jgi:hypothetical protein
MKTIYLAGPYTADTPEQTNANVTAAIEIQAQLLAQGRAVFSPHANYGHGQADLTYQEVMLRCFAHLEGCDQLVLMPGWRKSNGSVLEYNFAREHQVEIAYWDDITEAVVPFDPEENADAAV